MLADRHDLYDDRIYWKEACSLVRSGYDVSIVLASDENKEGKTIEGISYFKVKRKDYHTNPFVNYFLKKILPGDIHTAIFNKAASLQADVYHIHDLKVMRIAKKLKHLQSNPWIIYDVHEPYPENYKDYRKKDLGSVVAGLYSRYISHIEKKWTRSADLIISTEENIQKRFSEYFPDKPVEIIYNYTDLDIPKQNIEKEKKYDLVYSGGITEFRGAWKILEALKIAAEKMPGIHLLFVGTWFPQGLKGAMSDFLKVNDLEKNCTLLDAVPYQQMTDLYYQSRIGLGIFLPIETHRIILQIKIFEYMAFGLPLIASNFGHINHYVLKHNCGLTVDPTDSGQIAKAILELLQNKKLYNQFSENGNKAAEENYRWPVMEEKLLSIYKPLLS